MIQQLQPNTTLQGGKYRIERMLGQGGFGITYEGLQVGLSRKVAIKEFFLREYCERDGQTSHVTSGTTTIQEIVEKFREKFIKEAQMIASFDRAPHIVPIYDIFEENGTAYYVMRFVEGGSLSSLVKEHGALPVARAVSLISQIGQALSYLHSHQTMHLDVKPANILLDHDADGNEQAVLIDFGISKHYTHQGQATTTSPIAHSKGFAPLEQYREGGVQEFSPTSDVYSLGATLYYLLTAQIPPEATLLIEDPLERPAKISIELWQVVSHAMESSRKKRYQSVNEMMQVLDRLKLSNITSTTQGVVYKKEEKEVLLGRQYSKPTNEETLIATSHNEDTLIAQKIPANISTVEEKKIPNPSQRVTLQNRIDRPIKRIEKPFSTNITANDKPSSSNNSSKLMIYIGLVIFLIIVVLSLVGLNDIQNEHEVSLKPANERIKSTSELALELYQKDADAGDTIAQRHIAYAYEHDKNYANAIRWWQKLADQGHPLAQRKIGKYYHDGLGVLKDLSKALDYYTKAALQGEGTAQNNLALMYLRGEGVEKDLDLAAKWMLKAGESGDKVAMYNLGAFYQDGRVGVERDLNQAKYWYRKSADKGYEPAINILEELGN